jgi:hypothetical protein
MPDIRSPTNWGISKTKSPACPGFLFTACSVDFKLTQTTHTNQNMQTQKSRSASGFLIP